MKKIRALGGDVAATDDRIRGRLAGETLGLSPRDFAKEARFLLAAKLYELGKVSSGHAAKFCGMDRAAFLLALPRSGVPASNLTNDDLESETL